MYEIACNASGLLEGRKPISNEADARMEAQRLANERGEAFQLWDSSRMLDVIDPEDIDALQWAETCEGQKRAYANFEY